MATKKTASKPEESDDTAAQEALKAEATDSARTIEYDGTTYTLDQDSFDDLELVEALADFDATANRLVIPQIVAALIGDEQYAQFKGKYRNPETGRVPFTPLRELFFRIDASLGE